MKTVYIGNGCRILDDGVFSAKYKVEYNGKRNKYTLYSKRGAHKFDTRISTDHVGSIVALIGQYETGNVSKQKLLDLKSKLEEVRSTELELLGLEQVGDNDTVSNTTTAVESKVNNKAEVKTDNKNTVGESEVMQEDRDNGVSEEDAGTQYYGYNLQPEESGRAVWRIMDGHLELRVGKGSWDIIPIFGCKDALDAMMKYDKVREYYYDAFEYPLDSEDKEFALYRCLEYHNGFVVQLKRQKRIGGWRYDRMKTAQIVKFGYYDGRANKVERIGGETKRIRYRVRRDNTGGIRQLSIDLPTQDNTWVDSCKIINGINVRNELEAAMLWVTDTRFYDKTGKESNSETAIYKIVAPTETYSRLYVKDSNGNWRVNFISSVYMVEKQINKLIKGEESGVKISGINVQRKSTVKIDMPTKTEIRPEVIEVVDTSDKVESVKTESTEAVVERKDTGVADNKTAKQDVVKEPIRQPNTSPTVKSEVNTGTKAVSDVLDKVYSKIAYSNEFSKDSLKSYLELCVSRNRRIHKNPIINTRLLDRVGQFIYIYDYGYERSVASIDLDKIWSIESLDQAKSICDEIEVTSFPEPIQWSNDPYNYLWNPLISISPISNNTYDLISNQVDRLHPSLRDKDLAVVIDEIKRSCEEGEKRAKVDVAFALPYYNKENDTISMMLPLRSRIISGDKALNAMLFSKGLGYSLYSIIPVDKAREAVRLFRDPSTTWLREGD